MKNHDFRELVDQSLSEFVLDERQRQKVLHAINEEEKPVKKVSTAFVLVMVLMFVTMAVGFAAGTGILDYLFRGNAKPTAQQKALVQSVNVGHTENGVSTTVTEALASGNKLSMAFSITADQPVWVHMLGVTVNDEDAPGQDTNVLNQFVGDPMKEGARSAFGGLTCDLSEPLSSSAHVKVRLAMLVPNGSIVHKSHFASEEEIHDVIGQGMVFLTGDQGEYNVEYDRIAARNNPEQDAIYAQLEPYYYLDRDLTAEEKQEMKRLESMMYSMADLYVHYGNMTLLDDFTIEFTLNADSESAVQMNRAEVDEMPVHYGVQVEQAQMDAMGFTLRAKLYPIEGGWNEDEIEQITPTFKFYDEMREPLQFQDTWAEKDSGGWQVDEDGKRYTEIDYRMPALENLPALVYATPDGTGDTAEPLWEDSIVLFPGDPADLNG